jgi:hypothetical protein
VVTRVQEDIYSDAGPIDTTKAHMSRRATLQSGVRLVMELQATQANRRNLAAMPSIEVCNDDTMLNTRQELDDDVISQASGDDSSNGDVDVDSELHNSVDSNKGEREEDEQQNIEGDVDDIQYSDSERSSKYLKKEEKEDDNINICSLYSGYNESDDLLWDDDDKDIDGSFLKDILNDIYEDVMKPSPCVAESIRIYSEEEEGMREEDSSEVEVYQQPK